MPIDYYFQPPFKRSKVLTEKFIMFQDCPLSEDQKPNFDSSSCGAFRSELWSSLDLTPCQRLCRTRLLQQRQLPVLDLEQLNDDMLFRVTGFLDAPSLLTMRCLSRRYLKLCSSNQAGWDGLCHKLWENKVNLQYSGSHDSGSMMKAYRDSTRDARDRQFITRPELCYDPVTRQGTVWSFRFKSSAGTDWTSADPWYNGDACRQMVFLIDGTVKQYVPASASLRPPQFGAVSQTARAPRDPVSIRADEEERIPQNDRFLDRHRHRRSNYDVVDSPLVMTWRFITRPMDLPTRPQGSYVRITVGGRDVPTYSVRRSPTGNWGFIMESCWGLFASFELPPRMIPRPLRLRRTSRGSPNGWVGILFAESEYGFDSDEESTYNDETRIIRSASRIEQSELDPLLIMCDDSFTIITNEIQWREAFLYNVGVRSLPEGDEATDEFDRAWGGV